MSPFQIDPVRRDGSPRSDSLQTVHDDLFAAIEARADDAQAVDQAAGRHGAERDDVLVIDDVHDAVGLVGADRLIGHEHRARLGLADQPEPDEQARNEQAIGIVQHRTAAHRAGERVDAVVHEVHRAFVSEIRFVAERDAHRIGLVARARTPAGGCEPRVLEIVLLAGVDVAVDGIQRDDGREKRGLAAPRRSAADQVADGDDVVAGAAVDRCSHLGELDVELRLVEPGLGGVESGLCLRARPCSGDRTPRRRQRPPERASSYDCASFCASSSRVCAPRTSASAAASTARNGRGSITNSRSPFLTIWPSLK